MRLNTNGETARTVAVDSRHTITTRSANSPSQPVAHTAVITRKVWRAPRRLPQRVELRDLYRAQVRRYDGQPLPPLAQDA
jgi:hypothetical protein